MITNIASVEKPMLAAKAEDSSSSASLDQLNLDDVKVNQNDSTDLVSDELNQLMGTIVHLETDFALHQHSYLSSGLDRNQV